MLGSIGSLLQGASAVAGLFGGGGANNKDASRAAWESADIQENLWKRQLPALTEGARRAGLHPLVGAGINPASGPTVGVVGDSGGNRVSDALDALGQNLSRSAAANEDKAQRAHRASIEALSLERAKLENDLLRAQITTVGRPTNPPIGGDAIGSSQGHELNTVYDGSKESGSIPDYTYARDHRGDLALVPSQEVKTRIEDMTVPELQWSWRNSVLPYLPWGSTPPYPKDVPPPSGYDGWRWNRSKGRYVPHRNSRFIKWYNKEATSGKTFRGNSYNWKTGY